MSEPDDLYPPVQYGGGWMILAIGIIVLVIVGVWLILRLTRPRVATAGVQEPAAGDALALLRGEYLAGIAQVEERWNAREIGARAANLELSRLARRYVNEYSGLEAPVLTLDDLVARGVHPALIDALRRHYYPSIFGRGPVIDPVAGAKAARRVVTEWH